MQHASREALGSCTKLSREHVAEVCAERFCCACAYGCFNTSKFQWVARPDSGAGTRPKRLAVLEFPFLAVMLVPGQQRLTVFCVLRPRPVLQVLWQVQVWRSLAPLLFVLLEPEPGVFFVTVGNVSPACVLCPYRWRGWWF